MPSQLLPPVQNRSVCEPLEGRTLFSTDFAASVDFQPNGAESMPGYAVDAGEAFATRPDGLTYGWSQDVSRKAKTRLSEIAPDDRYETFIAPGRATWDLAVPVGTYTVRVVAGDGKKATRARVEVEGVTAIDGKTTKDVRWLDSTVTVTVVDGLLTVAPLDGFKNNRLAFLDVAPAAAPAVTWAAGVAASPQTRVEAGVAHVGTKVYVMGGYVHGFEVDNGTDVFDAVTQTWTKGPDFPGSQTHASVTSDGERYIYKVAGQIGEGIPGTPTNEAWRLDTVTNEWTPLPPLPGVRYAAGMQYVDGKLYLFGGDEADRTTVTSNTWMLDLNRLADGWVAKAPIPEPGDHLSSLVIDGQIYAIGGEHGHATRLPDTAEYVQHTFAFRYDPATDTWTRLADLPFGRSHAEGTTLAINGKIVVMGGKLNATDVSDSVEVYDPRTNEWTHVGTLPQPNQGGMAVAYGGQVFLTFGQEGAPDHTMWQNLWVGTMTGI